MDTALTEEATKLLDRLYNLRGTDSEIIKQIDDETLNSGKEKDKLKTTAEENRTTMEDISHKKVVLETQYASFNNEFKSISGQDFSVIFAELGIEFDIDRIKEMIKSKFPETQESLETKVSSLSIEISECEGKIKEIEDRKAEIDLKKSEAINYQSQLNRMLEEIFNGSEDISKQSVKNLLKAFKFSDEECDELAKMLIFPEDSLFIYDKIQKQNATGKTVSAIVQGAKEAAAALVGEVEETPDKGVIEIPIVSEVPQVEPLFNLVASSQVISDELKGILTEIKLDITKFTKEGLAELEACEKKEYLISNNVILKKLNIWPYSNPSLLADLDLKYKVNQLLDLGKSYEDIAKCWAVLNIDGSKMQSCFNLLTQNGYDLNKIPLIVYLQNPENYLQNINELKKYNYIVDENQKYNNAPDLVGDPINTISILIILKEYGITLTMPDGKLSLCMLNIDPDVLEKRINQYIEAGAGHILTQNPRYLLLDADAILARIRYCQANNIPYITKPDGDYLSYVFSQFEFENVIKKEVDLTEYLFKPWDINKKLTEQINGASEMIKSLNGVTVMENLYPSETATKCIKKLEEIAIQGENEYKVENIFFSKPRVVNNLKKLDLDKNAELFNNPSIDEILLLSLFAGSEKSEEDFMRIAEIIIPKETFGGYGK